MASGTSTCVGREYELQTIAGFLEASGFRALVLEGEAGIGKTTLWNAGVAAAAERGHCVLACRPSGNEIKLSFAALGDLLADVIDETLSELPPPQRHALEVALLLEHPARTPVDQRAIGLAVLGVLLTISRTRPVLVAVDDEQWLDRPTAAALEFALRRFDAEPVALLSAVRSESGRQGLSGLSTALPQQRSIPVEVGPLSLAAIHRLVRAHLDIGLPRPLLVRLHETSGGNPFYALELARLLGSTEPELRPGGRLPVPPSLQELVEARLAALPESTRDVLLAIACQSNPTVSTVSAATGVRKARSALAVAAVAGVVRVDGDRIAFSHPLLASGVYSAAGVVERRRMHRRLAAVVEDPEACSRHLALGTACRDAKVADALDLAARLALERGAPSNAVELLELAIEATPVEQEDHLRRRMSEAADAQMVCGALEQASATLRSLLAMLPSGDERADVLVRLAEAADDVDDAFALLEEAEREVSQDLAVRSRIHLALGSEWQRRGLDYGLRHASLALRYAEQAGDRRLVVRSLAKLGLWNIWGGNSPADVLLRAMDLWQSGDGLRGYDDPRLPFALWRIYQGRLDEARALIDVILTEALKQGDEIGTLLAGLRLVDVELRAGNWQQADAHVERAYESAEQMGFEYDGGLTLAVKALVSAHLGRVSDARSAAEAGIAFAGEHRNTVVINVGVLGFLELSLGRNDAALSHLRVPLDWWSEMGLAIAPHPMCPYALEALIACGELGEAGSLIDRFECESRKLESAWGAAIALRCRGLLAAAADDPSAAQAALQQALSDQGEQWPFERARTLLYLGRVQRRSKQKAAARQSLEAAVTIFDRLPAPLWAERGREELARLGLRRGARDELTETEHRVAELAASGLKNREVAARLFMSPKTVEANLARVYRKLGIKSRAELGARLAAQGTARAKS